MLAVTERERVTCFHPANDAVLDRVKGAAVFSSFDLASGYGNRSQLVDLHADRTESEQTSSEVV